MVAFSLKYCVNTTENNDHCRPQDEIESIIKTSTLRYFSAELVVDAQSYTNPISESVFYAHSKLTTSIKKEVVSIIEAISIITDSGWLLSSESEIRKFRINSLTPDIGEIDGSTFFTFYMFNLGNITSIKRVYAKIQDIIAQIMAILSILIAVFGIFAIPFAMNKMYERFINEIFEFEYDEKDFNYLQGANSDSILQKFQICKKKRDNRIMDFSKISPTIDKTNKAAPEPNHLLESSERGSSFNEGSPITIQ